MKPMDSKPRVATRKGGRQNLNQSSLDQTRTRPPPVAPPQHEILSPEQFPRAPAFLHQITGQSALRHAAPAAAEKTSAADTSDREPNRSAPLTPQQNRPAASARDA